MIRHAAPAAPRLTDLAPGSGHGAPGGSPRVDWIEPGAQKVPSR